MASASNLGKSGASYDIRLNDHITQGLDKIIRKLNLLDKVGGRITGPIKKISQAFGKLGRTSALTAVSTTVTAVMGAFRALFDIVKAGIRVMWQFGRLAVQALKSIITEASHATETMNAFMAVFRQQGEGMVGFTNLLSGAVGRSATDMRNFAKSFQAFFVGLDLAPEKAAVLSRNLTRLTADFGSFFDRSDEKSFRRFISALSGSSEVLDQFGINIAFLSDDQKFSNNVDFHE